MTRTTIDQTPEPMPVYSEGTLVRITDPNGEDEPIVVMLYAWDSDDQLCEDEGVYNGFAREDYHREADAAYLVKELRDGSWIWCNANAYQGQFHDEGGLRIVGYWRGGRGEELADDDPDAVLFYRDPREDEDGEDA